jgi:hypothetical protein
LRRRLLMVQSNGYTADARLFGNFPLLRYEAASLCRQS